MSIGGFELIGECLLRCETCGKEVPSGLINITGHWAECAGKETMQKVNSIADANNSTDDKIKEISKLFNLCG